MIIDIVVIFQMDYRKWNKQDTIVYKIIYIYIYIIYIYIYISKYAIHCHESTSNSS